MSDAVADARRQRCVVLAGGLGTRLRSETGDLPKCLARVGARSFIEIQLEMLASWGIDNVALSLGHRAQAVIDATASWTLPPRFCTVVEKMPLGTGGAIAHALDVCGWNEALVINGDTWIDADIAPMLAPLDLAAGELCRMATCDVADLARFGGVTLDSRHRVVGFVEKARLGPGTSSVGLYRTCRAAMCGAPGSGWSFETATLPALVTRGHLFAARLAGRFIDIGMPDDYRRFCAEQAR